MKPAVSAVIATYNSSRFLPAAVDSVLGQTMRDVEAIVVDDGSSDDTPQVMQRYRDDRRVRYYRQENRGPAAARNLGIRRARARLVAFLDADDIWLPQKLERQVPLFRDGPGLAVVYARRLRIDEQGRLLQTEQPELFRDDILPRLFVDNCICLSSAVVARAALEWSGLFDERIRWPSCEDYGLWLRLARDYRFDYVDEPLVLYRMASGSDALRSEARLRTVLTVMGRFLDEEGGRRCLDEGTVRRAWAETYAHLGLFVRERAPLAAFGWFCKALAAAPAYGHAWKGLASTLLPEVARRYVRRALGRPAVWPGLARGSEAGLTG
jgi:glycosyltransferase involved in cell wall biosynthesis